LFFVFDFLHISHGSNPYHDLSPKCGKGDD